jgi:hypothetical protein
MYHLRLLSNLVETENSFTLLPLSCAPFMTMYEKSMHPSSNLQVKVFRGGTYPR